MKQDDPIGSITVACIEGQWYVLVKVRGLYNGQLAQIGPAPNEREARAYARQVAEHLVEQLGPSARAELVLDTHGPKA